MSRQKRICIMLLAFVVSLVSFSVTASAAVPEDGTYTVDYTVIQGDNDSVSMANDYWEKPAKVVVQDGNMQLQMTVNHSSWVTEFKVPSGSGFADTTVISEDTSADTRVTEFSAADLSAPLESKIHVTVPDINYDHDYTIRFRFDEASLTSIGGEATSGAAQENANSSNTEDTTASSGNSSTDEIIVSEGSGDKEANTTETAAQNQADDQKEEKVENPQTSDNSSLVTWGIIALAALSLFIGFKYVTSKTRGSEN